VIGIRYLEKGRREAPQSRAVAFGRTRVFQSATNDIPSELRAQAILKAEQKILKILKMNKGPFMSRITLGGNVPLLSEYFEAHRDGDLLTKAEPTLAGRGTLRLHRRPDLTEGAPRAAEWSACRLQTFLGSARASRGPTLRAPELRPPDIRRPSPKVLENRSCGKFLRSLPTTSVDGRASWLGRSPRLSCSESQATRAIGACRIRRPGNGTGGNDCDRRNCACCGFLNPTQAELGRSVLLTSALRGERPLASPPERVSQPLPVLQAGSSLWIAREVPAPLFATLDVALRVADFFKCENRDAGETLGAHRLVVDDAGCGDGGAFTLEVILAQAELVVVALQASPARSRIVLREAREAFKWTSARVSTRN
jgi:hypothetical protein